MNFWAGFLNVLAGAGRSILGLVVSTMQSGFKAAIQFHKEGIAFARDAGLSAKEAQAYTNVLIERTQVLANRYGVTAEAIMQVQRGLSEATGKQLMLNSAQAEGFVQIDKMMGAQSRAKFTEEIMNGMGGQIDTVQNAMAKVYATASKQGLNAKKLTDKVVQNLSMANRLSFRNGIEGITRMAALSEKLGINMQSVESAAGNFLELDKAIENAAKMQMLGGSAAVNFGNPLTAAFEANYDPEAFAQRLSDSLASYATFNSKTGISNINGQNMDFVRNIASAMGITTQDAVQMAKKNAEVKYKEGAFGSTLGRYSTEERNFILNKSYVQNGRLMMNDINGKAMDISSGKIPQQILDEMRKFEGKSDRDILERQARTLISIDEQISGAASTVAAGFAKGIEDYLPGMRDIIKQIGDTLSQYSEKWGEDIGQIIGSTLKWINENGPLINKAVTGILGGITSTIDWLSKIENKAEALLAAIVGWGFYKAYNKLYPNTTTGAPASGKPSSPTPGGGGAKPNANQNTTNLNGGGPRGGTQVVSKPDGNYFNHGGNQYREVNGQIQQRYTKNGKESWKPVHKNQANSIRETYNQKLSSDAAARTSQPQGANPASTASGFSKWGAFKTGAKAGARGAAPIALIISSLEAISSETEYRNALKEILKNPDYTDEEKKELIEKARKGRLGGWGQAVGGAAGGIGGAALGGSIGATLGALIAGGVAGYFSGGAAAIPAAGAGAKWGGLAGSFIGGWLGGIGGAEAGKAVGEYSGEGKIDDEELAKLLNEYEQHTNGGIIGASPKVSVEKHDIGGVIGGNSYSGDKIKGITNDNKTLFGVNSYEMVITRDQQAILFNSLNHLPSIIAKLVENNAIPNTTAYNIYNNNENIQRILNENASNISSLYNNTINNDIKKILNENTSNISSLSNNSISNIVSSTISSVLENKNDVKAKPVGEKEYIYIPTRKETSTIDNSTITVKDFNINVSGTIKLDGGNFAKNIDMDALLNDFQFMNTLKEMIKTSINQDMNGGRFMNDWATLRGQTSPLSVIGR